MIGVFVFNIVMKNRTIVFLLLFFNFSFSQNKNFYLEDQIYINFTLNYLQKMPKLYEEKSVSYGFDCGYIRDIPFNKNRNIGLGIGLGYIYEIYKDNLFLGSNYLLKTNEFRVVEKITMPFELRWRNSTFEKYKFWRVYGGLKISYILNNELHKMNPFEQGIILSVGYASLNLHMYYGLSSVFSNNFSGFQNANLFKMGAIFYLF